MRNDVIGGYLGQTWYGFPIFRTVSDVSLDLNKIIPTANVASENRPVNMAVRYLIRALP